MVTSSTIIVCNHNCLNYQAHVQFLKVKRGNFKQFVKGSKPNKTNRFSNRRLIKLISPRSFSGASIIHAQPNEAPHRKTLETFSKSLEPCAASGSYATGSHRRYSGVTKVVERLIRVSKDTRFYIGTEARKVITQKRKLWKKILLRCGRCFLKNS